MNAVLHDIETRGLLCILLDFETFFFYLTTAMIKYWKKKWHNNASCVEDKFGLKEPNIYFTLRRINH